MAIFFKLARSHPIDPLQVDHTMGNSDIPGPIWTSAEGSMAQATAKTRWPRIVKDMIHDIQQTVNKRRSERQVEQGAHIIEGLTRLRDDLESNQDLV